MPKFVNLFLEHTMHFWNNVLQVLDERHISIRSLARDIGVSPTSLSNYSRGAVPGLDVALKIARHLEVPLEALTQEPGQALPTSCPAPEEHHFLRELVSELGLNELLTLSRLGSEVATWKLADVLAAEHPRSFTLAELSARLELEPALTEASLISLRRRRLVGVDESDKSRVRWLEPVARFKAQTAGDVALHMKRAVKMLLGEILPAIDRRDESGHLITIAAKVPREKAQALSDELRAAVFRHGSECTAETGSVEVNLVFGVAVEPSE